MFYKSRTESCELLMLKSLNSRMHLLEKDQQHYFNLKKGYEGELLFDSIIKKLQSNCLIINDLLLQLNNTLFQIDSLIIIPGSIYFFEVKNLEGDFYYESDRLYHKSQKEVNNPLIQLNRSESLLRQLLQNLGVNQPIYSSVVFINSEFSLYQAPPNKPFIFPTQINRYFHSFDKKNLNSKLNESHKILADKLISLHIKKSPYKLIPSYHYDQLQKGISCAICSSLSVSVEGRRCVCKLCGYEEVVATAVMRNAEEFKLLFPDHKITTNAIYEWCKVVDSKKRIRRILNQNFIKVGVHQWSFYE